MKHHNILYTFLLSLPCTLLHATTQRHAFWNLALFLGKFGTEHKGRYLLEHEVRVFYIPTSIIEARSRVGLGYKYSPTLLFFGGYQFVQQAEPCDEFRHHNFWQEVIMTAVNHDHLDFAFRTRFEEFQDPCERDWAIQVRQKGILQLPKRIKNKITPIVSDEIFVLLKKPAWVSQRTIEQNRLFIGIQFEITKRATLEIGYLNAYKFRDTEDDMVHVIEIQLSIAIG